MLGSPALRRRLHRHLEAAQMRSEKHDALAPAISLLGTFTTDDIALRQLPQPDTRHLEHHAPGMPYSRLDLDKSIACLRRVSHKSAPIGG